MTSPQQIIEVLGIITCVSVGCGLFVTLITALCVMIRRDKDYNPEDDDNVFRENN